MLVHGYIKKSPKEKRVPRSVSENPVVKPESEQFFRLTKTPQQAILVLSSIQADAVRRKKGRSKLDRILRHAPRMDEMDWMANPGAG